MSIFNSHSGNLSEVHPELRTIKDTSSSSASSDASKLSELLAGARTPPAAKDPSSKPLPTAPKKKRASTALGDSANLSKDELDAPQDWSRSVKRSRLETTSATSSIEILPPGSDIREGSKDWPIDLRSELGVTSPASTSTDPLAPGSRLSSTTQLVTSTFTRSQARHLFGSTATQVNVFSSLTSLTTLFNAKYSYASWTVILTRLLSKEGSSMLAGLASCFAPITTTTTVSTTPCDDDSTEEEYIISSDSEGSIQLSESDSEERSGSDSEYQRYPIPPMKRSQWKAQQRLFWTPPTDSE